MTKGIVKWPMPYRSHVMLDVLEWVGEADEDVRNVCAIEDELKCRQEGDKGGGAP